MTIVIFSQRQMRYNAINILLMAVAVCDLSVIVSNYVFVKHYQLGNEDCPDYAAVYTYGWAVFQYVHANISVIGHAGSLWSFGNGFETFYKSKNSFFN